MNDTICAVSTAPGTGGIAVVRLSGPDAFAIFEPLWKGKPLAELKSHSVHLGNIVDPRTGDMLDEALITIFRAPQSFTGDDTIEISIHGSVWIQSELIKLLISQGARLAEAGEFTRRAFTSGRLDLAQAEAVADIIAARSRAAHRIAASQMRGSFSRRLSELRSSLVELASLLELELDFSDQEVEFASRSRLRELAGEIRDEIDRLCRSFDRGQAIAEGIPVAIVGDTNAGKSTLLNRIVDFDRAIVSQYQGTTRDTIEETATIGDILFRFIDTAGIRQTDDPVEAMGIDRSRQAIRTARIILWVIDSTASADEIRQSYARIFADETPRGDGQKLIAVANKSDLTDSIETDLGEFGAVTVESISAATGDGIENLKRAIVAAAGKSADENDITITNLRHYQALDRARQSIDEVVNGLDRGEYSVFIAQSLRETLRNLGEITGEITDSDILGTIFSRFCVGK